MAWLEKNPKSNTDLRAHASTLNKSSLWIEVKWQMYGNINKLMIFTYLGAQISSVFSKIMHSFQIPCERLVVLLLYRIIIRKSFFWKCFFIIKISNNRAIKAGATTKPFLVSWQHFNPLNFKKNYTRLRDLRVIFTSVSTFMSYNGINTLLK